MEVIKVSAPWKSSRYRHTPGPQRWQVPSRVLSESTGGLRFRRSAPELLIRRQRQWRLHALICAGRHRCDLYPGVCRRSDRRRGAHCDQADYRTKMMGSIDLHVHSTASDGTLTPAEIVDMAERRAIEVIALTDHDTVAESTRPERAAGTRVRVIPGVEISADDEGVQAHVLGYFINHTDASLVSELHRFQRQGSTCLLHP